MSDIGGINFGPKDDPFIQMINSIQTTKKNYKWIELLNILKQGKINPPLFVKDSKGYIYEYDFDCGNFINEEDEPLVNIYNDIDLLDLELTIIDNPKKEKTTIEDILDQQAKNKLKEELEFRYMDLSMELDNCQGCCDNLEEHFAELRVLSSIIEFLGGDLEKDHDKIYDNWYKIVSEKDKKEIELKKRKDDIIETLPIPLIRLTMMKDSDAELSKFLLDVGYKINELCNIYRNQVDKKEDL